MSNVRVQEDGIVDEMLWRGLLVLGVTMFLSSIIGPACLLLLGVATLKLHDDPICGVVSL